MIKDLTFMSKCVSCLVCARRRMCVFSKLLHRPLRWRPGEGKLDGARARSVFHLPQTWEQDTCGRRQTHRRGFRQKINTRTDFSVIALLSRASRSLIPPFANGLVFTQGM